MVLQFCWILVVIVHDASSWHEIQCVVVLLFEGGVERLINNLWSLHRFRRVSANKAVFQGLNSVWNIGIAKGDWEWDVLWFLLLPGLAIVPVITNILYVNCVGAVWRCMENSVHWEKYQASRKFYSQLLRLVLARFPQQKDSGIISQYSGLLLQKQTLCLAR